MPVTLTCTQCGTDFSVKPRDAGRKFCGFACYKAYEQIHGRESNRVEPIMFSCAACGKPFQKNPGELRAYRKAHGQDPLYCSRPCGWVSKRKTESKRPCIVCGNPVPVVWNGTRTVGRRNVLCSHECRSAFKLAEHERLKPLESREVSRTPGRHGYIRLIFPRTAESDGYEMLEHRYIMEQALGRKLLPKETIHHKNGQKTDNRFENLELRSGNHGPGGDVSAMIKWAHDFIALYPQFDRDGVLRPVNVAPVDH